MSVAVVLSRAAVGIEAPEVAVEVHIANGLPAFSIVGLPEMEVKESKDRVRAALMNARFEFPMRRITVNLAPADLPKEGGRFDLPIAIGILAASGQIPIEGLRDCEFAGELALTGDLRPIRGVMPMALKARARQRTLILPRANIAEAALVPDVHALGADHLLEVSAHLNGQQRLTFACVASPPVADTTTPDLPNLSDVRGQHRAKRALEIAAAGAHSILFVGPPGSGKSMLASRLPGILPPMTDTEALESAAVLSTSHAGFDVAKWRKRPFRAPHHTASGVALVGGGSNPMPGEISLAHHGVLFLDELPEFDRRVLEVLREPLESGAITISRAARSAEFPARFQLVAAMNPCPCGWHGDASGRCRCTSDQVRNYRGRISGPLLDRIDLHVEVPAVAHAELLTPQTPDGESSAQMRARVLQARAAQGARGITLNARLDPAQLDTHCELDTPTRDMLQRGMRQLGLSARAAHRILKVARTIADLAAKPGIESAHVAEAMQFRVLDRGAAGAMEGALAHPTAFYSPSP